MQPVYFDPSAIPTLSMETIKKAQDVLGKVDPMEFLKGRMAVKDAKGEVTLDAMEKMKQDATIRRTTKKRGGVSTIEIGVRKIELPKEAKG